MFRQRFTSAFTFVAIAFAGICAQGQYQARPVSNVVSTPRFRVAALDNSEQVKNPLNFRVNEPSERLEMIVRASRILTLDYRVPRMLANNAEIIKVTPLSPNQIQVSALKPGVTQLTLWDEKDNVMSIDVIVYGDARELDNILKVTFPEASIKVIPLASSVMLSGFVPEVDLVARIVRTAEDYYPKVVNNLTVGGTQKILLHVKVMEVSRTKLRKLGFDWAQMNNGGIYVAQSAAGLLSSFTPAMQTATGTAATTVNFGVVGSSNQFFGFIEALRQYDMVKTLAEPTLVTVSGRPATFMSGGEFPFLVPQSLGTVTVQYRQYGTRVDFVPLVLGKGAVRLEVRPQVTELDPSTAVSIGGNAVPGLLTRWVDTAVEMKVGHTFALAGLLQQRVSSENKGVPFFADLPWVGGLFRRVSEQLNEVELLITVTPEFAEAVDPTEMPPCGPGLLTTSPSDCELYGRGYLEVPKQVDNGNYGPQNGMGAGPAQGAPPGAVANAPKNAFGWPNGQGTPANTANNATPRYPTPSQQTPTQQPPVQQSPVALPQNVPTQNPRSAQYGNSESQAPPQVQVAPVTAPTRPSGQGYSGPANANVRTGVPKSTTVNPVSGGDGNLLGPIGYDDIK